MKAHWAVWAFFAVVEAAWVASSLTMTVNQVGMSVTSVFFVAAALFALCGL